MIIPITVFVSATTVDTPNEEIIFMIGLLLAFTFIISLNSVINAPTTRNMNRIKNDNKSFL